MHAAKHHWQSARDIVNEAARCWVPCHKVNPENPAAAAEALPGLLAACKGLLAQVGFKARVAGDEGHFTEAAAFARAQIAKATTEGTR